MKEKYGFIYIWRDRKYNRYYIGMHWGLEDDGYICSSTWMMQAYKNRPNDFKRRILDRVYTNRKELYEKEKYWLSFIKDNEIKKRYYNLSKNVRDTWLNEDAKLTRREKISIKTKEAMNKPDVREKYLKGLQNRDCRSSDINVREKRSQSMKNTLKLKHPDGRPGNCGNTTWWNNGIKNVRRNACPGIEWVAGRISNESTKQKYKELGIQTFTSINNRKVSCIHCGFTGNPGNIGRYHNNKCKKK
jgi:hypothetical protein